MAPARSATRAGRRAGAADLAMDLHQILLAIGSAVVGALLVAFIQPWWTNTISLKSKLVVTIWQYPFLVTKFMQASIEEYRDLRWNQDSKFRPSLEHIDKLRNATRAQTFSKIVIENRSKHFIESVKLSTKNSSEFCADFQKDGLETATYFGKTLEIGDLMPDSTCLIYVWLPHDIYSDYIGPEKEKFKITAKKYDHIEIRHPAPEYITRKNYLADKDKAFYFLLFCAAATTVLLANII
jgi:hypothetical protein